MTDESKLPAPEETLTGFWRAYAACEENQEWKESGFAAFHEAQRKVLQQFCTQRLSDKSGGGGYEAPSQFNNQHAEKVIEVQLKKNKAFIYTHRPDYKRGKYCWVLVLENGAWKIDRRKQEGMQLDKYREISLI